MYLRRCSYGGSCVGLYFLREMSDDSDLMMMMRGRRWPIISKGRKVQTFFFFLVVLSILMRWCMMDERW